MKEKNVGITERVLRIVGGGTLAAVGLVLLLGGSSIWGSLLEVAGIALGVDFVYTGLTGYCPLYRKLGRSTNRHNLTGAI
ncbi:MAG TPA: DUF2892 domain-containing protein [Dehalococcoidia bacterium]|nr:DUF2892 domain-containing protein [Dehalococcoidia bacterium]